MAALLLPGSGCASTKYATVRERPKNPLTGPLNLLGGGKPTERTMVLLRRYDLAGEAGGDTQALLAKLQDIAAAEPSPEHYYAMSELAYLGAKKKEPVSKKDALDLYGASATYAYLYLFDPAFGPMQNPFDPHYRGACDLYNTALESALRLVRDQGVLAPGQRHTITTARREVNVTVVVNGSWRPEDFDQFEFVSDYEVAGLTNHHRTHGLGVPLIAVRKPDAGGDPSEKFYPPRLAFPVTAFLRITGHWPAAPGQSDHMEAVLELCDPLAMQSLQVAGRQIPLETDLTTPLAYFLNQPELDDTKISTFGLVYPESASELTGMYMLEPFRHDKIPVVMVHGLWSSPITWMEMFNDLRSDPHLRRHYQFWFYLYPTGQPFWLSAAEMRHDLAELREMLDPLRQHQALDHMVLVGHSMGGLVSKLQTVHSGDDFWRILSDKPLESLQAEPEVRQGLAQTLYFDPNPAVRRVVTIGTPHRGSDFANDTTRWLGRKVISLPQKLLASRQKLLSDNPDFFRDPSLLAINTSIDSLAPNSPFLPVLLSARPGPRVRYHNVVGRAPAKNFLVALGGESDGVVKIASASLSDVQSEVVVPADHSNVHRHPRTILEVRRILQEHLAEVQLPGRTVPNGAGYPDLAWSEEITNHR